MTSSQILEEASNWARATGKRGMARVGCISIYNIRNLDDQDDGSSPSGIDLGDFGEVARRHGEEPDGQWRTDQPEKPSARARSLLRNSSMVVCLGQAEDVHDQRTVRPGSSRAHVSVRLSTFRNNVHDVSLRFGNSPRRFPDRVGLMDNPPRDQLPQVHALYVTARHAQPTLRRSSAVQSVRSVI